MSLRVWDERVVPRLTDLSLRGHEVGEMREVACAGLTGRVLEIGFGSGSTCGGTRRQSPR